MMMIIVVAKYEIVPHIAEQTTAVDIRLAQLQRVSF